MSARVALEALFRTATSPAAFEHAAVAYLSLQESVDIDEGGCSFPLLLYRLGISEWAVVRLNHIIAVIDRPCIHIPVGVVLSVHASKEHILKSIADNQQLDPFGCQLDFKTIANNIEFV